MIRQLSIVFIFALAFVSTELTAQFNKELYAWESHLPQQVVMEVTQSEEDIYYATRWSVVRVDKETYNPTFISKVEGLSETGISELVYDEANDQLIIVYDDGSIDFLFDSGELLTVGDFKANPTYPDKTINKAVLTDDGKVLYGTRFGVLAQRTGDYFFDFTTNMELNVVELAQEGSTIFAATEEGLYRFDEDGIKNPGDFTNWEFQDGDLGLGALYNATDVEFHNGKAYAVVENELYVLNDTWEIFYTPDTNFDIASISTEGNHLVIATRNGSSNSNVLFYDGQNFSELSGCGNSVRDVIEIANKQVVFADNWHGFRVLDEEKCIRLTMNSPYSFKAREIRIKNSEPYIASGGINNDFLFDNNRDGFFVKRDGQWINYNGNSVSEINANSMINMVIALAHPTKDIIYGGAFPGGILEINNETGETKVYNCCDNSPLEGTEDVLEIERVADLLFDENENLWVTNYLAENPLHVLTPEGIWHSFEFDGTTNLGAMLFDDFGNLWIQLGGSSGGVLVLDINGNLADPTNHEYKILKTTNSAIPNNRILSLAKDLDGEIWVGTQSGPVIFECGDIFENECFGSIRKVLQDSIPAPLLETEAITTIAIDGANRKWLGSSTGIFVQSPDGETQVERYTVDNSLLFDNNIIDLAYDGDLGEMYIATNKGVQSVRIDATSASKFFSSSDMYAFPNPVRPEWEGPIAIRGLAEDANVKITDIQGRLIFETTANGGLAIWDGRDYNGNEAESGVYTVFATYIKDLSDLRTETTKILIVR